MSNKKRVMLVVGNWKMHKTIEESVELCDQVQTALTGMTGVEVGIAPAFVALSAVNKRLQDKRLRLAAQNVHFESQGAYTGEVSLPMLKSVGCQYVIIGHSERRQLFFESDTNCGKKVGATLRSGLRPILCVGETLAERESGQTLSVVSRQLNAGLEEVTEKDAAELVVAYEPVWAIGTGRTATPAQAQDVHAHLRRELQNKLGDGAEKVRLQYGGSVKADNARDLFSQTDIDGGLIGGASLDAKSFFAICVAAAAS